MKNEEIRLLNIQLVASILFIGTIIISIITIYDEKLKLLNKNPILGDTEEQQLIIMNRIFVLILAFVFLYANYKDYETATEEEKRGAELQLLASSILALASIIALYATISGKSENIFTEVQNPIL